MPNHFQSSLCTGTCLYALSKSIFQSITFKPCLRGLDFELRFGDRRRAAMEKIGRESKVNYFFSSLPLPSFLFCLRFLLSLSFSSGLILTDIANYCPRREKPASSYWCFWHLERAFSYRVAQIYSI